MPIGFDVYHDSGISTGGIMSDGEYRFDDKNYEFLVLWHVPHFIHHLIIKQFEGLLLIIMLLNLPFLINFKNVARATAKTFISIYFLLNKF